MTDRKQALTDLLAKVEAGAFTPEPGGAVMPHYRRFTDLADIALPQDVRALDVLAHEAYKGSIDAAKRLHEAVLPGWTTRHHQAAPDRWHFYVARHVADRDGTSPPHEFRGIGTPARAWLIAVLKALIAQEGAQ